MKTMENQGANKENYPSRRNIVVTKYRTMVECFQFSGKRKRKKKDIWIYLHTIFLKD